MTAVILRFVFYFCLLGSLVACGGASNGDNQSSTPAESSSSALSLSSANSSFSTVSSASSALGSSLSSAVNSAGNSSSNNSSSSPNNNGLGLSIRPNNETCLAGDAPPNVADVKFTRVFTRLPRMSNVLSMKQAPNNSAYWYVVEKNGRILRFDNTADADRVEVVLDIRSIVNSSFNEAGLLAMAFHPDFENNGYIFVWMQKRQPYVSVLARYKSNDNGKTLDQNSRKELITLNPPFNNHYGGELAFDKNGYLFLSIGDGGSGGDPGNRAQNTKNIFGTMLRLDVNSQDAPYYSIPSDNPFFGNPLCRRNAQADAGATSDCPEIYAWGLRNVWRFSFDSITDELWAGDVGQERYEEIDIIQQGGNYGWRIREGAHCYRPSNNCRTEGLIEPVAEVAYPEAASITGGLVYRGERIPALKGRYVFADYQEGTVWALFDGENGQLEKKTLSNTAFRIAHFTSDENDEMYFVNYANSRIYRIDPDSSVSSPVPTRLSETGCVKADEPTKPATGMISYSVNTPFWSDGAVKTRYFALPNDKTIAITADGQWELPVGAVTMKNFFMDNKLIETRLMRRHTNGQWAGYSYKWDSGQTDATLVNGGDRGAFNDTDWVYPRSAQCLACHTEISRFSLGLTTAQLKKSHTYETTQSSSDQLETLYRIGVITDEPDAQSLVDPFDPAQSLEKRARAYLHTNCAQCHRQDGPVNVDVDFRYDIALADMNICNAQVKSGDLGLTNIRRLTPGNAERSALWLRMNSRDEVIMMPPLGSYQIDERGVELIEDWINSLANCN